MPIAIICLAAALYLLLVEIGKLEDKQFKLEYEIEKILKQLEDDNNR